MLIEKIQKYWDDRPCNVRHSNKDIDTPEYSAEVEKRKYLVEPHIPLFADFPVWRNKDVLEIGCGIGTDSLNFHRHGAHLTAIELSPKSMDICLRRFRAAGYPTPNYYLGNAEKLDEFLPKGRKYDLIYSFGVIHHTASPEKIVAAAKRRLKKDGELRIMLYSKYSFKLFDFMHQENIWDFGRADEIIRHYAEAQLGCPQALTYTFADIKKLLKDFDLIEMKKDHIFKYSIPDYIEGRYVVADTFKNMESSDFAQMCGEVGWHTLVRAVLKK
jgi:SAM-dependent methyltransferase